MRVLFATYLSIQGLTTNVELVNGNNKAVIAMGDPFRSMFAMSHDPNVEVIQLIYSDQVVSGHLPDLDGIVLAVEEHGLEEAQSLARFYESQHPGGEVHLVAGGNADGQINLSTAIRHRHSGDGDSRRIMQLLLQRFLAIGTLKARF